MNLDIKNWKKFRIGDYFDVFTGGDLILRDVDDGKIPVCSHSAENNGVGAYVCFIPERKLFNCQRSICLADRGTFHATVQADDYYIGTRVKALVLKESLNVDVYSLLFIATIINVEAYRYSYGRNCTNRTEDITISLPVSSNGMPDWTFMRNYMKSLRHQLISTANRMSVSSVSIRTDNWGVFVLGDLFEIKKGKRLTSEDQSQGETPYVGAIDSNNGLANKIGQAAIHAGNTISLSYNGSVGEAFYQPEPFWATDDVNVLYFRPENGIPFNKYIALFICTILRQEKYRYSYGRKWILGSMKETIVKLPTRDGKPDWEYMENYIKSLPYGDRI